MSSFSKKISDIVEFLNNDIEIINLNKQDQIISGFNTIQNAKNNELSFCSVKNENGIELINKSNAGLILCPFELRNKKFKTKTTLIFVRQPRLYFIKCIKQFSPRIIKSEIHETAVIKSKNIGKNTSIGAFSFIDEDVIIGENCQIYPGVQIYDRTHIGDNSVIYPSVIIGDSSFGPQRNESLELESCKHLGGVHIGNDVEIGSNTSVLAGFLEDTKIDDGTKISSQVYIGSGMKIGKNCMITGNTYFGGSSILEDNVYVAPGSVIRNGIKLSSNSFVGMGSVVVNDIPENITVIGNPAKPVNHNSDTNAIENSN